MRSFHYMTGKNDAARFVQTRIDTNGTAIIMEGFLRLASDRLSNINDFPPIPQ